MKPLPPQNTPRAGRPRRAVTGLLGSVVLGALLGTAAYADMYHQVPMPGGVSASSTITSIAQQGTNVMLTWYGPQGSYFVEMTPNNGPTNWAVVGTTVASDYAWSFVVTNVQGSQNYFRIRNYNGFVGSGACGGCHGDKYAEEIQTLHAFAYTNIAGLPWVVRQNCVVCHTVGYGQPTGFVTNTTTAYLLNVGCENCHGPGGAHKYGDHSIVHPVTTIDPAICGGCHQDSHHPTYEEYSESLHAQVNDDVNYGFSGGFYSPATFVTSSNTWYGYYVVTNAGPWKTNATTGIVNSLYGPANNPIYDAGQDRQAGCGVCHSGATRMSMLYDYEARLAGRTNALALPSAHDSSAYGPTCAVCHDPHSDYNTAQLRNPTRSTNFFTMPTTADKRTIYTTNFMGAVSTNVAFYNTAFATFYDDSIQVCGQCHNNRGARWDGRSYGLFTNGTVVSVGLTTNVSFSRPPHHSPQYNLLVGIVQPDYFTTNSSGVATNYIARHGVGVSSSSGNYNTNQCATCHVPYYSVNANTNVTGHTFDLDTHNCTLSGCHGSVPRFEDLQTTTTNSITRIVDLLNQWGAKKGPGLGLTKGANNWDFTLTGALAPTPNTSNAGPPANDQANKIPTAIKQARFNLYMAFHDGSLGVHNPGFTSTLLADAESKVASQFTLANFKAYTFSGFTPLTVGFTNMGTGVTGYNWNFGDGNTSTAATPTNIYANPGLYAVTLTATDGINSETLVRTNYISVATKPVVSFTADQTTVHSGTTVNFTNTSTSTGSVTQWRWSIDGKVFYYPTSSPNTSYTFVNTNASTSYNIVLRAYTSGGNITTTSNAFITVLYP